MLICFARVIFASPPYKHCQLDVDFLAFTLLWSCVFSFILQSFFMFVICITHCSVQ